MCECVSVRVSECVGEGLRLCARACADETEDEAMMTVRTPCVLPEYHGYMCIRTVCTRTCTHTGDVCCSVYVMYVTVLALALRHLLGPSSVIPSHYHDLSLTTPPTHPLLQTTRTTMMVINTTRVNDYQRGIAIDVKDAFNLEAIRQVSSRDEFVQEALPAISRASTCCWSARNHARPDS